MSSGEVGLHEEEEKKVAYFGFESQRKESFGFESQRREKKNEEDKMATSEVTISLEKRRNYVLENVNEQDIMMATNEISLEETMCLEHYERKNEQVITNATESQNYIESFDVKEWNYR